MSDSTILVKSPDGWKVKAAVGLGGLAVVVILAFLYRLEVGVIVLAIGLSYAARVAFWTWHQRKLIQYEQRRLEAEALKLESEALQAKARSYFVETDTGVFVLDGIEISRFYPAVSASRLLADAPALLPPVDDRRDGPVKRLLDIDFIHMLIRGPSGSGKTTIGNWLIDNARARTAVYVLDPHASQNASKGLPWAMRAEVVGDGRDWVAIDNKLVELIAEMDERYKQSDGRLFQEILIVSDEWLTVLEHCPHARVFFETIGSEARKVDMRLVIMTVSATVDDLKCSAAVRDNLVELRLDHGLKSRNRGELRWGRGNVETVELPGPYRAAYMPARAIISASHELRVPEGVTPLGTEPMPVQEPVEPEPVNTDPIPLTPTGDELRVCELWDKGATSLRAIWKEVYKTEFGGNQADKLKAILVKWGRVIQ